MKESSPAGQARLLSTSQQTNPLKLRLYFKQKTFYIQIRSRSFYAITFYNNSFPKMFRCHSLSPDWLRATRVWCLLHVVLRLEVSDRWNTRVSSYLIITRWIYFIYFMNNQTMKGCALVSLPIKCIKAPPSAPESYFCWPLEGGVFVLHHSAKVLQSVVFIIKWFWIKHHHTL